LADFVKPGLQPRPAIDLWPTRGQGKFL
jgi:hypothetical protein